MKRFFPIGVSCVALFLGCGGDFDPASRVDNLRVLAVRADAPYAAPGSVVHLEALAHDPGDHPLTWGWGVAKTPPSSSVLDAIDAMDWTTFTTGAGASTFETTIPADSITELPPAAAARAEM